MKLHFLNAVEGFEGADENTTPDSRDFGAYIEHEVVAIAEIDVGMAAAKEHGSIAWGRTPKVVRGGIALRIGLRFHYSTAKADAWEVANDDLADEKPGQGDGIRR